MADDTPEKELVLDDLDRIFAEMEAEREAGNGGQQPPLPPVHPSLVAERDAIHAETVKWCQEFEQYRESDPKRSAIAYLKMKQSAIRWQRLFSTGIN